jgi:hypothetical protein
MKKTIAEKFERASQQHEAVSKSDAEHPKAWDKYIAERQVQQQKLAGGKKHATR